MNLHDLTPEQLAEWDEWCSARPPEIGEIARRLPPWKLYRLRSTDQKVTITSYDEADPENGWPNPTVRVNVSGRFNFVVFDRDVFGVDPEDLEECDPPRDDEPTGTVFHGEDAEAFIEYIRPMMR